MPEEFEGRAPDGVVPLALRSASPAGAPCELAGRSLGTTSEGTGREWFEGTELSALRVRYEQEGLRMLESRDDLP